MGEVTFNKERLLEGIKSIKNKQGKSITQEKFGYMVGLTRGSINRIINGRSTTPETANLIAKVIGLPLKYLTGEDDYKTEKDRLEAIRQGKALEYQTTIKYLETLGIKMELHPFLSCNTSDLPQKLNSVKAFLYDEPKHKKLMSYNDNNSENVLIKLKSSFWVFEYANDDEGIEYTTVTTVESELKDMTKEKRRIVSNSDIDFYYEVSINNETILIQMAKMHDLLRSLDDICKTAAASLLLTNTFSNVYPVL